MGNMKKLNLHNCEELSCEQLQAIEGGSRLFYDLGHYFYRVAHQPSKRRSKRPSPSLASL